MRYYAEFYDENNYRPCGSDSILKLDGRLSIFNMQESTREYLTTKGIKKFKSFKIFNCHNLRENWHYVTDRITL